MFNNAEEHLQEKYQLQQLNFPVGAEICSCDIFAFCGRWPSPCLRLLAIFTPLSILP